MIWLPQDIRQRAAVAVKILGTHLTAMIRELTLADEHASSNCGHFTTPDSQPYGRTHQHPRFCEPRSRCTRAFPHAFPLSVKSADLFAKKILDQYAAVRARAPDTVVETGIADGVSSAYRLLLLQKKGKGCCTPSALQTHRFYHAESTSADLFPSSCALLGRFMSVTPEKLSTFPHNSRLSGYLSTTGTPSYDHMMWEFEAAYPKLQHPGLLVSDDVFWEWLFYDFACKTGEGEAHVLLGVGFVRKKFVMRRSKRTFTLLGLGARR
jgi:hypothetical protein